MAEHHAILKHNYEKILRVEMKKLNFKKDTEDVLINQLMEFFTTHKIQTFKKPFEEIIELIWKEKYDLK